MALPGLSFAPGSKVQNDVLRLFGQPVTLEARCPSSFALVVAFGRCKFRLDCSSVGLLLQATVGGLAEQFHVSLLSNRTFKFFVSSRLVGFHINSLRSFSCDAYKLTFHLWSNGGPDWRRELRLFLVEEARSWHLMRKKGVPGSARLPLGAFASPQEPHRSSLPLSGANSTPLGFTGGSPAAAPGTSFADIVRRKPTRPHPGAPFVPQGVDRSMPRLSGANAIPLGPSGGGLAMAPSPFPHAFGSAARKFVFLRLQPRKGHGVPTCQSYEDRLGDRTSALFCQRCLLSGHRRAVCMYPIRCRSCFDWGHIAERCHSVISDPISHPGKNFTAPKTGMAGKANRPIPFGWFNSAAAGPSPSSPPIFPSFAEMARTLFPNRVWATRELVPINVAGADRPITAQPSVASPSSPSFLRLSLDSSPPAALQAPSSALPPPSPLTSCPSAARRSATMAYQRADPRPFLPASFQWVDVPNREYMCRAVAPIKPPATNEDLAIVTFDPLPGNELNFFAVRNVIREFLDGRNVRYLVVLPCHLGQAYVRFAHAYDRDNMVSQSPLPFGNTQISFTKHNEGRNWRRVFFNEECWVMMLGFPEDYKSERHIQNAVGAFGRLMLWEESEGYPGKIMARVRVTNVQAVPHFIVYSDSSMFMETHGLSNARSASTSQLASTHQRRTPFQTSLKWKQWCLLISLA